MTAKQSNSIKILSVLGFCVFSVAFAQSQTWTVREYGDPNNAWTSEDPNAHPCGCISVLGAPYMTIAITANPSRELKFEIYYADPNGVYDSAAPLNDFTIDSAVDAELIEIRIAGDPNAVDPVHEFGASNIAKMNIAPGNFGECVLKGLKIFGDLATTYDAICDSVQGDIYVAGKLHEDGHSQEYTYDLVVDGAIDGDIFIEELHGQILVPNGTITGDITTGDVDGTPRTGGGIDIAGSYSATIAINDGFDGRIAIGGGLVNNGRIEVTGPNLGEIDLGGDLVAPAQIFSHTFLSQPNNFVPPSIRVRGDLVGGDDPNDPNDVPIRVGTTSAHHLRGTIAIDGSVYNYAIAVTGQFEYDPDIDPTMAAVTADYDGGEVGDKWQPGAYGTARHPYAPYTQFQFSGNAPEYRVWDITECIGDLNNNGELDPNDPNDPNGISDHEALLLAIGDPNDDPNGFEYQDEEDGFPGLYGSRMYHGDVDCDGDLDEDDLDALDWVTINECCMTVCQYRACRADFDKDGEVDLGDLAELLGTYDKCPGDEGYNPDCNIYENDPPDGCIYLNDLAELLGVYSDPCDCFGDRGAGAGEGGGTGQAVSVSVEPYDTDGYAGKGFAGERDHFVFDVMIELDDPDDDWTTSGVVVTAENGAAFRLAAKPTVVDPYASFVSTPRVVDADADSDDSGAAVVGAYWPPDEEYEFDPSVINISWFDLVESHDGPAGVMRLVIDVSGVADADTTGGLGSVYFSQTGPAESGDVKVADFSSATGTRTDAAAMSTHTGEFFVKTE